MAQNLRGRGQFGVGGPQTTGFGEDAYRDLWSKAAALLQSLVKNHAGTLRAMVTGWLGAAVPEAMGMRIPGAPAGQAADAHLGPDALVLRVGQATARFAWDQYEGPARIAGRRRRGSTWWVTHVTAGRHDWRGVAIEERHSRDRGADALRAAIRAWRWRFLRTVDTRHIVPLEWSDMTFESGEAERTTFAVLLAALSDRPVLRARLVHPQRVERLVRDLRRPLVAVGEKIGARRATAEALRAMGTLGYRHPYLGRPLPGDRLASLDEVVDRVMAHVGRNPYARDVRLDPEKVAGLAGRHYLDIEPWPLAGLTEAVPELGEATHMIEPERSASRRADPGDDDPGRATQPPDGYGAGHRPTWWRAAPPWAPADERD